LNTHYQTNKYRTLFLVSDSRSVIRSSKNSIKIVFLGLSLLSLSVRHCPITSLIPFLLYRTSSLFCSYSLETNRLISERHIIRGQSFSYFYESTHSASFRIIFYPTLKIDRHILSVLANVTIISVQEFVNISVYTTPKG